MGVARVHAPVPPHAPLSCPGRVQRAHLRERKRAPGPSARSAQRHIRSGNHHIMSPLGPGSRSSTRSARPRSRRRAHLPPQPSLAPPPPASSARCRHAAAAAAASVATVAPPRRKCAMCRRPASPRSTQADRRNRKRTAGAPASPVGRPRAPRRAAPSRRGSPPEFHARRPRPAASGGRRIDRRRHRTGAGVRRLCARTRATAPGRRGRRSAAPRRGAARPRSAAARRARGSWSWLDQLGVAHPAHVVHSHRHSPPRSRGAFCARVVSL